jgi:hypothetical protein
MNSITVTDTRVFNEREIHSYTTVSFIDGEVLPNLWVAYHPSVLSSALLSMYWSSWSFKEWHIPINMWIIKDVCCVANSCFQLVYVLFEILYPQSPSEQPTWKQNLTCLSPIRNGLKVNSGFIILGDCDFKEGKQNNFQLNSKNLQRC